jgi:CRP-like cAMP-binding protein
MTATALEDTCLLKIRSDDFYELLADQEEITPVIFRSVIERVGRLVAE